jgi:hypothetical protein
MKDDNFDPTDPENSWIPIPPPGAGRLRRLLENLDEDTSKLTTHHLYKEGYDDGYLVGKLEAEEASKCLVRALTKLYDNSSELN